MQYKVPQNVDIEDKVVGPLTLRQFLIILITVGIILLLYFLIPDIIKIFFWLIAAMVGAAGIALAFMKYGDQNPEIFLVSALKTISNPRQRVWKKVPEPVLTMDAAEPAKKEASAKKETLEEAHDNLEKLATLVDSGGYVQVEPKDRVIGDIRKSETDANKVTDILDHGSELEATIKKAKTSTPKHEPLISEVASVNPNKKFTYQKIQTRNN